uniref:Arrestin C-terminal-like domain-containing protein n=1 Tax=Poecilia formosa TaxID=48698 RepID=A0A096LZP8_POEFO
IMTVKHFSVEYDKVKDQGTYSPGDVLSGKVTVVTTKEIKVQTFLVRAKGKTKVSWYEQEGQNSIFRSNKKKYFYFEHIILQDKNKGDEIMGAGINVFPFSFVIPSRDMPSSYRGKCGEITYSLRAHLTQSIWLVHKTKTEFPFLTSSEFPFASKSEMIIIGLKHSTCKVHIFEKYIPSVSISIHLFECKTVGEAMGVFVEVLNASAHSVTPKFYLCEKLTFVAHSRKKVQTKDILFGIGDAVPAEGIHTVTKVLIIPPHLPATFFNCSMMNLEYRIKITLGVPLLRDAEIKLPLVI